MLLAAGLLNAWLGWYLLRVGKRSHSLILEGDGKHVLTDSFTSFGVVAGLGPCHVDWMEAIRSADRDRGCAEYSLVRQQTLSLGPASVNHPAVPWSSNWYLQIEVSFSSGTYTIDGDTFLVELIE